MISNVRYALIAAVCMGLVGCSSGSPEVGDAAQHLIDAQQAIEKGDSQKAIQELDAAITLQPDAWAYFERARLHTKAGADEKARADVQAGLKLDPSNDHLKFIEQELRKPKPARFAKGDAPAGVGK